MARAELTRAALSQHPRSGTTLFDYLVPAYRAAALLGPEYDAGDQSTGMQLLHKGRALTGIGRSDTTGAEAKKQRRAAVAAIHGYVSVQPVAGFSDDGDVEHCKIYLRVVPPSAHGVPLRLAVCSIFRQEVTADSLAGVLLADTSVLAFHGDPMAIDISDLVAPLVCARQPDTGRLRGCDVLRLVRFGNCSRL